MSAEILLKRNILSYNVSSNESMWTYYSFSKRLDLNPILIGLVDKHFFPILSEFDYFYTTKKHRDVDLCGLVGIKQFPLITA